MAETRDVKSLRRNALRDKLDFDIRQINRPRKIAQAGAKLDSVFEGKNPRQKAPLEKPVSLLRTAIGVRSDADGNRRAFLLVLERKTDTMKHAGRKVRWLN